LQIRALFVRVSPDSSQTYLSSFRFSVGFGNLASVPLRENGCNELMRNQPIAYH